MKKTGLLLTMILLLLRGSALHAAEELDFVRVDAVTYRLFMEKKWDSVVIIGKKALRQDIDFYYLRVRMGIACFEKTDYFPSATHLKKAREFNSGETYVAEYLYWALVYTNRTAEAGLLRKAVPGLKEDSLIRAGGIVEQVHIEAGYNFSSDRTLQHPTAGASDTIYGEQDLYGNNRYGNLGLTLRLSNRIRLSLAYNYLNFDKTKFFHYGRYEDQLMEIADSSWGKMYLYSFPWVQYDTGFRYQVVQHEVYVAATILPGNGFRIIPAFHYLHMAYPNIRAGYALQQVSDTGFYLADSNQWVMFPFNRTLYSFTLSDTVFGNYVAALGLSKDAGNFCISLAGSWSNLNGSGQKQIGASLTWYPLGNLDLYETTTATGFFQKKNKRLLLSQVIGARITPWMWAEGNFFWGDFTNANINNGSIVYNNSDLIDYRLGLSLMFAAGRHFSFSLIYQHFRKESREYYYVAVPRSGGNEFNTELRIKENPYQTNFIIGGITWKP